MTEEDLEKKAEEYVINLYGVTNGFFYENKKRFNNHLGLVDYDLINSEKAYKDGYEQGQKDFDTDVTKLLNSYGVKFIDTNSIGGLIALHQLMLDLEKENEELKDLLNRSNVRLAEEQIKNEELKAKYDELNDFSNSQCANLLKTIAKMKNCQNCKKYELNKNNKDGILYCCACKLIDSKKEKLIYTKWELAE